MKILNKIGLISLMILILSMSVSAVNIVKEDLDLDYTTVDLTSTETVNAFRFVTTGDFSIGGVDIVELVAVFDGTQPGLYYKVDSTSSYQFLSLPDYVNFEVLEMNNAEFVIYQHSNLRDMSIDEAIINSLTSETIDVDNSPIFLVAYSGTRPNVLETSDSEGWLFFLLENGDMIFLDQGSGQSLAQSQGGDGSLHYYTMPQLLEVSSPLTGQQIQEMAHELGVQAQHQATQNGIVGVDAWDTNQACFDADNSNVDLEASYTTPSYAYTDDGMVISDRCQYDAQSIVEVLSEATCTPDGELLSVETVCTNGCSQGKCGPSAPVAFCIDTDQDKAILDILPEDFEAPLISKGATAGFYASKDGSVKDFGIWKDYCSDSEKLVEYFCKNDKARFVNINCYGGCADAVCEVPLCFDSDGGDYEQVPGLIKGLTLTDSYEFKDVCQDNEQLIEYYCDGNEADGYNSKVVSCNEGCVSVGDMAKCVGVIEQGDPSVETCIVNGVCEDTYGETSANCPEDCSRACTSDLGCKVKKQCDTLNCQDEPEIDLTDSDVTWDQIIEMLQRRLERLDAYDEIISQLEEDAGITPDSEYGAGDSVGPRTERGDTTDTTTIAPLRPMTLSGIGISTTPSTPTGHAAAFAPVLDNLYDKNFLKLKSIPVKFVSNSYNGDNTKFTLKIGSTDYGVPKVGGTINAQGLRVIVKSTGQNIEANKPFVSLEIFTDSLMQGVYEVDAGDLFYINERSIRFDYNQLVDDRKWQSVFSDNTDYDKTINNYETSEDLGINVIGLRYTGDLPQKMNNLPATEKAHHKIYMTTTTGKYVSFLLGKTHNIVLDGIDFEINKYDNSNPGTMSTSKYSYRVFKDGKWVGTKQTLNWHKGFKLDNALFTVYDIVKRNRKKTPYTGDYDTYILSYEKAPIPNEPITATALWSDSMYPLFRRKVELVDFNFNGDQDSMKIGVAPNVYKLGKAQGSTVVAGPYIITNYGYANLPGACGYVDNCPQNQREFVDLGISYTGNPTKLVTYEISVESNTMTLAQSALISAFKLSDVWFGSKKVNCNAIGTQCTRVNIWQAGFLKYKAASSFDNVNLELGLSSPDLLMTLQSIKYIGNNLDSGDRDDNELRARRAYVTPNPGVNTRFFKGTNFDVLESGIKITSAEWPRKYILGVFNLGGDFVESPKHLGLDIQYPDFIIRPFDMVSFSTSSKGVWFTRFEMNPPFLAAQSAPLAIAKMVGTSVASNTGTQAETTSAPLQATINPQMLSLNL
jgi:hypothetical protein